VGLILREYGYYNSIVRIVTLVSGAGTIIFGSRFLWSLYFSRKFSSGGYRFSYNKSYDNLKTRTHTILLAIVALFYSALIVVSYFAVP